MGADGRPSLQFESPRGAKPPTHWADLSSEDREAKVIELGLPKFRAKQLSTHYFTHYTSNPDHMTDLPAETRAEIVGQVAQPTGQSPMASYLSSKRIVVCRTLCL